MNVRHIVLASFLAASSAAFAQANNQTPAPDASGAMKASPEERAAARKARIAAAKGISADERMSTQTSQSAETPTAQRTTKAQRAEARKARLAAARQITADNQRNPTNNQTGMKAK